MTPTRKIAALIAVVALIAGVGLIAGSRTDAAAASARAALPPEVVKITASRYRFTPDRIVLAKDRPVTLELTSSDRTHGFMVRPLGIDTDIEAGKTTAITLRPAKAGSYTTICDHYCGLGHNSMKMTIIVR